MAATKNLCAQIPEDLFQRIKAHLERESARTGKKLTQREFVLGLIEEALNEAERQAGVSPCEAPQDGGDPQPQEEDEPDLVDLIDPQLVKVAVHGLFLARQLSLSDDPSLIPTEDGYVGVLRLDHTSVQVATDGYATKTSSLSATRSYPNLSEADISLIPKSIEDKGKTLTLGDVKWSESMDVDGEGNPITHYTATASYTGTTSSRYATGYTVSANYTGEVSKAGCSVVTYTAIFGSEKAPEENTTPGGSEEQSRTQPLTSRMIQKLLTARRPRIRQRSLRICPASSVRC